MTLGALKSSEGKWSLNSEESVYLMEGCCESPADMFRNQNIYDLMIQDMFYMLLWRQSTTAFELMYIKYFSDYNTNAIVFPNCFRWRAAFLVTISYYPTDKMIYVCYRSIGKR